jgi:hypothetical protein
MTFYAAINMGVAEHWVHVQLANGRFELRVRAAVNETRVSRWSEHVSSRHCPPTTLPRPTLTAIPGLCYPLQPQIHAHRGYIHSDSGWLPRERGFQPLPQGVWYANIDPDTGFGPGRSMI